MLVIWGRSNSINVQKVLWCCEEMGLAYQRMDAGGAFGVVSTQRYRELNPNGLVPAIDDDGFVLWESNAVVRYLAARHSAGNLWPSHIHMRAEADCWMEWCNTTLWPALRPLFIALIRTPPQSRDRSAIEDARLRTAAALRTIDMHLANHEHVAGEAFSMGDIPLACCAWRWLTLPIERPALGNLERWFDAMTKRPAYRRIVMHPLS